MKVFEKTPKGARKVILATNIAETSITIAGVKYVVDTGVAKVRSFNAKTGTELLNVQPISKSAARQRAGRAGRESSGICFRLYTEQDFQALDENTIPEIKRTNISTLLLQLKALGIEDVINFDYLEQPPLESIKRGLELLFALGALTSEGVLSIPLGKQMSELPLDPPYSRVLLSSKNFECSEEVLSILSMLSVESDSIFFQPKKKKKQQEAAKEKFISVEGDHLMLLNVFNGFVSNQGSKQWCSENYVNIRSLCKAKDVRGQLKEYCASMKIPLVSCGINTESIRRCFVTGFFMNAAQLQPDGLSYKTVEDHKDVFIHPSSTLFGTKHPYVLFNESVLTKKKYLRNVMAINFEWLLELAPQYYNSNK